MGTFRLRSLPKAAGRLLGRFFARRKAEPNLEPASSELASQAASAIVEYARDHAALFERAERLRTKAERLERAGTPIESAANRAQRARAEVEAGLLVLRDSFAASAAERRRAFDREVGRLYPALGLPGR